MHFALTNDSTLVSDADARAMAAAIGLQMRIHVATAWRRTAPTIAFYAKGRPLPADSIHFKLIDDDPSVPDALGYHDEQGDKPYAMIMCKPVFDSGGTALHGSLSVSAVLSHEAIETMGDVDVNAWRDMPNGDSTAEEWCDAVQDGSYVVVNGVSVSNFLLPAWFDRQATTGPFDYMRVLTKPFSLTKSGYLIVRKNGKESQVFGSVPPWKRANRVHRRAK